MVDLHARIPLERRRRNVVVIADADDGRIRIEATKNRIANHCPAASRSLPTETSTAPRDVRATVAAYLDPPVELVRIPPVLTHGRVGATMPHWRARRVAPDEPRSRRSVEHRAHESNGDGKRVGPPLANH